MPNAWLPGQRSMVRADRAQLFRIGDVARLLGEDTATLRFWEKEFSHWVQLHRSKLTKSGHRLYSSRDLDTLREIQRLLRVELYTVEGAKRQLQLAAALKPAQENAG